jgi:hypothetical protein
MFLRVAVNFVEHIRVSEKCSEARIGAEQNRPSAIFSAGIIDRVRVVEDTPAKRDELLRVGFGFDSETCGHLWYGGKHEIASGCCPRNDIHFYFTSAMNTSNAPM